MNRAEERHLKRIADLPCIVCYSQGQVHLGDYAPVTVHHIRTGQGTSQRAGHGLTLPLCHEHHQGDQGIHTIGTKVWESRYGSELHHLNRTILLLESLS